MKGPIYKKKPNFLANKFINSSPTLLRKFLSYDSLEDRYLAILSFKECFRYLNLLNFIRIIDMGTYTGGNLNYQNGKKELI